MTQPSNSGSGIIPRDPSWGTQGYGSGRYGSQPIQSLEIGYYLGLLTSEWTSSPKLNALTNKVLKYLDDVTECLTQLDVAFDLSYAVGNQLDSLGVIIGASRTVPFQPSDGVSPTLDDNTYRIYLQAKGAANSWNGKIDGLYSIWKQLFPSGIIIISDQQNMSVDLILAGSFTSIIEDLIVHGLIVPRPEGVLYNVVFGKEPFLGFDLSNSYVAGFDTGFFV